MKIFPESQRALLLELVAGAQFPKRPYANELEVLFALVMSSVNVCQIEQLPQSLEYTRARTGVFPLTTDRPNNAI